MSAPFQCWLEDDGCLWMAKGRVVSINSTATVSFAVGQSVVGSVQTPKTPRIDLASPVSASLATVLVGGNGRNWKVSGGPSAPTFPAGTFKAESPEIWTSPEYALAYIERDPVDGSIVLNDGTDDLATGNGVGQPTGVPSAGTYPITDWVLSGYYPGTAAYYDAPGYPLWVMGHDLVTGDVLIQFGVDVMLSRIGGSTTDPSGIYTASAAAEAEYNGGSPWTYTVTGGSLSGTMSATTYGETTYNGGSPFTFDVDFEGDITGRAWM